MDEEILFGDFDDEDALDDQVNFENVDWDKVIYLKERYNEIEGIADIQERKNAAKALVRELNGEE